MSCYDRKFLKIAVPAAMEGLFMVLLASTDLIMVGALGALSIAAVAIFLQPRLVLLCFSRSLASSVTLLTSRAAGSGDTGRTVDVMKKSLFMCALFMGLLHVVFYLFLDDIFYIMGATSEYMDLAMAYGRPALLAVYVTSLTLILQAVELGYGNTSVIMKTNVVGNLVNICLNALLIFGMGPFPKLGITGAAIATLISALFTFGWTFVILWRKHFFHGGSFLPDKAYIKTVTPLFLSILSEQGSERIGMVLFARMAAGLGAIPFAVHSICMNICDVYYDFIMGFGKASMVTAGQSIGAGNRSDWEKFKNVGIKWSFLLSCAAFLIVFFFRDPIFALFTNDAASMDLADGIMIFVAVVSLPEAHAIVSSGVLRGSGKTAQVACYSFLSITVMRPLMTAFFLYVLDLGLTGCWLALVLDQITRAVASTFLLSRLEGAGSLRAVLGLK